jgi:hypothetical protein
MRFLVGKLGGQNCVGAVSVAGFISSAESRYHSNRYIPADNMQTCVWL